MKKLIFTLALAVSAVAFGASLQDIKPAAEKAKAPISVEWENKNDAALAAATDESVLAAYVTDELQADRLLSQVKEAYHTDPMVACQIAAVTQYVMQDDAWYWLWFDGPRASGRKVWVKSLVRHVKCANDDYVKMFCLDQLRWCGCPCTAKCIAELAAQEKSKAVKDFEEMVVRELEGKCIGLLPEIK